MREPSAQLCRRQYTVAQQKRYDAGNITLINLGFVINTIQRITHFSGIDRHDSRQPHHQPFHLPGNP